MNENDKILLAKYITRQASPEEISMAKYLISSSQQYEDLYVRMYESWQKSIYYDTDMIDADKAYSAFLYNDQTPVSPPAEPFWLLRWRKLALAASVILVCAIGLYYFKLTGSVSESSTTIVQREIQVPKGSTMKTTLSDGTKVWINAGSSLNFEPGFGESSRTVYLSGEAYFDIADGTVPFIVKTEHHTIRDIGTIFNVKAYADDLSFETTVIEGEISVEGKLLNDPDETQTVSVKQKQVLKLNYAVVGSPRPNAGPSEVIEMKVQKINQAQLEGYTGWTEDLLVFEGKTFQEIIKIMERKYDVDILVEDIKLRNYEYTGSFQNIDRVEKALQILRETTDIIYEINGRNITIREDKTKNKAYVR